MEYSDLKVERKKEEKYFICLIVEDGKKSGFCRQKQSSFMYSFKNFKKKGLS